MQIRENGSGPNPPLVYQPLRSPRSPHAKFGPGSSSTLPAKLSTNKQSKLTVDQRATVKDEFESSVKLLKLGPRRSLSRPCKQTNNDTNRLLSEQEPLNRELNRISERDFDSEGSILHSAPSNMACPLLASPQSQQQPASGEPIDQANNDYLSQAKVHGSKPIFPATTNEDIRLRKDYYRHHLRETSGDQQTSANNSITTTINNNNNNNNHDRACLTEVDNRSSSEDNSNASSDLMSCGYFSEDSQQSMTDLCGCPMKLRVQVKQYSDEKVLKKNLSQDNLLRADYISRPNDKCKCVDGLC